MFGFIGHSVVFAVDKRFIRNAWVLIGPTPGPQPGSTFQAAQEIQLELRLVGRRL